MTDSENRIVEDSRIKYWIAVHIPLNEIEKELADAGFTEDEIAASIRTYKKIKNAGKHSIGITCVIIGAVMGFLSCLLAILNPVPAMFHVFLYGITPVAILVLFVGLYLLFE